MEERVKKLRKQFDRLRNKGILADECGVECVACGSIEAIDYHHILPLVLGGDNRYSNIVPLCYMCHEKIHGHNMTRLTRWSANAGRPKENAPKGYKEVLIRYIVGEINTIKVKKELGLSRGVRIAEKWYYKDLLKEMGISKVQKKRGIKDSLYSHIVYKDGSEEWYINGNIQEHEIW